MRRSSSNRGMGVVFLFVLAMIVVVSVFLIMQAFSEKSTSQDISATHLGHLAGLVAESCVEEAAFLAAFDLNAAESKSHLFKELRQFTNMVKRQDPTTPEIGRGAKYFSSCKFETAHTLSAYEKRDDVKLEAVEVGLVEQKPLPPESPWCNESFGKMGFSQKVRVKVPSVGRGIERMVQYQKTFKVLLLAEPYPFNNYTLIIKPRSDTPANKQPFVGFYREYLKAVAYFDANGLGPLPEFPIPNLPKPDELGDATDPFVTTTSSLENCDPGCLSMPTLATPFVPPAYPDSFRLRLQNEFSQFKATELRKLPSDEAKEWDQVHVYDLIDNEDAWKQRATHVVDNFAEFVHLVSKDGVLKLNGIYFINASTGGATIDHDYTGRGIIVTRSPDGILVRKAKKGGGGDQMVLVALAGDITFHSGCASPVQADLNAPGGTIRRHGATKIEGTVFVQWLEPGEPCPKVDHTKSPGFDAWVKGKTGALDDAYAQKLRVFFSPGFLRRDFWNQRFEE